MSAKPIAKKGISWGGIGVLAGTLVILGLSGPPAMSEGNQDPGIAPPYSNAYGKSLAEWLEIYWRWTFTGEPASGRVGRVTILPQPGEGEGEWTQDEETGVWTWTGTKDLTMEPGTPFVSAVDAWLGESYVDGGVDEPFPDEWFYDETIIAQVTLDGEPIVEPLAAHYVPPTYFDPPIMYEEPTEYGSTGIVYFQGLGFVCAPLEPGVHQMKLLVNFTNLGTIYDNTWNIEVLPKGKVGK